MNWCDPSLGNGVVKGITLLSTDVFDTLLLRNCVSERSRIVEAERRFSRRLAETGIAVSADTLVQARLQAQRLAFRALDIGGGRGEVRFADIVERQLGMLGLPADLVRDRIDIEIDVEKTCLRPNARMVDMISRHRASGCKTIAISDTTLSGADVRRLIEHFCGPGLLDRVYSSADKGSTKREGTLFACVLSCEGVSPTQMLHVGDDETADHGTPSRLGIHTHHAPRSDSRRFISLLNGGVTEVGRQIRLRRRKPKLGAARPADSVEFGRDVLGPIVTTFCLRIWLYAAQADATNDSALLFCARGGVGIREAFERVVVRLGLAAPGRRDNLLVSRLVAARAAVISHSAAALQEIGREFEGSSFAYLARAIGGGEYNLAGEWLQPLDPARLFTLLASDSGQAVMADIALQNDLFRRHLAQVARGATRIVLCDTGLYASTQRLLAAGIPQLSFETIQFARANYKGHGEEHFPKVAGLMVEQNCYNPFKPETSVLRYWQLVESLFEPAAPSVRLFHETSDGEVASNSGDLSFGAFDPSAGNHLLTGVLSYIDSLPSFSGGTKSIEEAEFAWHGLRRAITRPGRADLDCIGIGARSTDFGRAEMVADGTVKSQAAFIARLVAVRGQLWREGAISRDFPVLKPVLLAMYECAHSLRPLLQDRGRR